MKASVPSPARRAFLARCAKGCAVGLGVLALLPLAGKATALGLFSSTPKKAFPVTKPDAEWKAELPPDTYQVMRRHGTERPNSSPLTHEHRTGTYLCAACAQPLFGSAAKFDSGTGWPSFTQPLTPQAVGTEEDFALLAPRTEVHCARCGGHLGHVFPDGPAPTGLRYCMNGVALTFTPQKA